MQSLVGTLSPQDPQTLQSASWTWSGFSPWPPIAMVGWLLLVFLPKLPARSNHVAGIVIPLIAVADAICYSSP